MGKYSKTEAAASLSYYSNHRSRRDVTSSMSEDHRPHHRYQRSHQHASHSKTMVMDDRSVRHKDHGYSKEKHQYKTEVRHFSPPHSR